jgi:hypothetical protein
MSRRALLTIAAAAVVAAVAEKHARSAGEPPDDGGPALPLVTPVGTLAEKAGVTQELFDNLPKLLVRRGEEEDGKDASASLPCRTTSRS